MHAVVIDVTFKDGLSVAEAELGQLVPQVSGAPGFVAGYWLALSEGKGTSVIVFESEEAAQALVEMVHGGPEDPMSVEVGEVMAHA